MPSTIYQLTTNFTPEKGSRAISACVQRHQVTVTSFLPEALKFMKLTSGLAAPIEVTHVCTNGKGKRKGREGVSGVKEKGRAKGCVSCCAVLCCAVFMLVQRWACLARSNRLAKIKKGAPPPPPAGETQTRDENRLSASNRILQSRHLLLGGGGLSCTCTVVPYITAHSRAGQGSPVV